MANNRANIRSALKALLSGATSAGSNVYTGRGSDFFESELPAIVIYIDEESARPETLKVSRYVRTANLKIEVRVQATENVDDDVDALLGEIETIIYANPSIGGTVQATIQTNSEIRMNFDADTDIGVGVLTFECLYIS